MMEELVAVVASSLLQHAAAPLDDLSDDGDSDSGDRPVRKVFVGNINPRTNREGLIKCFERCGSVIDAVIILDKNTNKKKFYGFVTFKDPADAHKALFRSKTWGGMRLDGRQLYVAPADSWHQPYEAADGTLILDPHKSQDIDCAGTSQSSSVSLQQDKDIDESKCIISRLNDDCLIHIFSYLNYYERIAIERVCKRWQLLSKIMWRTMHHLDANELFDIHKSLPAIIRRCGSSLTSLTLSHDTQSISRETITSVGRYCRELEELRITHSRLTSQGMRPLGGERLRVLDLSGCSGVSDQELRHLLLRCPSLEELLVAGWCRLSGWGLARVPSSLRRLSLDACTCLDGKQVVRAVGNIRKLELSSNSSLSDQDLKLLVNKADNLEELSMTHLFPLLHGGAFSAIAAKGEKLKSLDVRFNPAVTDKHLIEIIQNCTNLSELVITGCSAVEDVGAVMESLSMLKNLKSLTMSYIAGTSDTCMFNAKIHGFQSLSKLEVRGSPFLGDIGVASILATCSNLEFLDISGCQAVTSKGLSCAIEQRKAATPLEIVVGGTSVVLESILKSFPSVKLNFHNNCTDHLRPDFVDDYLLPMMEDFSDEDIDNDSDAEYDYQSSDDEYDDYDYFYESGYPLELVEDLAGLQFF